MNYPETIATPKNTSGSSWKATSPPSASPTTLKVNWETSFMSNSPKPGVTLDKGKTFGSVESVKAVSDIYAPISGQVIDANLDLATAPEKLNEDPHGAAWLIKVKVAGPAEFNSLLSVTDYQKYVGAES